ncbi:spherulation-specific family 4 protein [Zavarzinella formosa]|uniref:spherulation-specific family 4 protein n=1 Tax=Zavarzinella formosa TaxID=360055 RepID=UPI0002F73B6F|nr:spherulation-specific family 4 protein [Zavarzinella formosa]
MRHYSLLLLAFLMSVGPFVKAEETPAGQRLQRAKEFHQRSQERTGVLVPMYVYPENIHKNAAYNRLIELKRRHETVPMWVIINPASGPGKAVDANYTKAIDRLMGAGCVVLGYVSTNYGKRPEADVKKDIDQWLKLYPRTQGIFFDEMIYEDKEAGVKHQSTLNQYAHGLGYWPTVANPGAPTPGRYFAAEAADVIVVHEGDKWPKEETLKGDYFGGNSDYPPHTRAVLLHSQDKLDKAALKMVRQYSRRVYVTEGLFRENDPKAANPWGILSKHLNELCEELAGQ